MEIIMLGTSASIPTKERNVSSVFCKYKAHGLLFDCGEATQRQMNIAGITRQAVTHIFISHWHGDHMGGLIGLLQTITHGEEEGKEITMYGPPGSKERMTHLLQASVFDKKLKVTITDVKPKKVEKIMETEDYEIHAASLDHSTPCIGFALVEKQKRKINMPFLRRMNIPEGPHLQKLQEGKSITYQGKKVDVDQATTVVEGKKFVYITDTYRCENAISLAKDANLLVCEATYANDLEHKAEQYKHLTAAMAATIASQADVKKLVLFHFSQRYKTVEIIEEEATTIFPNTVCGKDFMKVKV